MKTLILAFAIALPALSHAQATTHPASQFVQDMSEKVERILAGKGDASSKLRPLCALMRNSVYLGYIGGVWLGKYAQYATDQQGVAEFMKLLPSILANQVMEKMDGNTTGSVDVRAGAADRGSGVFAVDVTVHTNNGNPYSGKAIVHFADGRYTVMDGEYFNFSGVRYLARDYQRKLKAAQAKNPTQPVSQVVQDIANVEGFVRCP
jgi:ABC-type transporter MlaC component